MALWRDIYSNEVWARIRQHTTSIIDQRKLTFLTGRIKQYHKLEKADLSKFERRRGLLLTIAKRADARLAALGQQRVFKPDQGHKQTQDIDERKEAAGRIDPWLHSLARTATKKREYLRILHEFYKRGRGRCTEHGELLEQLERRESQHGSKGQAALRLFGGTWLEKLDPLHRQIEFSYGDIQGRVDHASYPLNQAFFAWAHEVNPPPFYIWLENHPVCTMTPLLSRDWSPLYKSNVRSISYDLPAVWEVRTQQGRLQYKPALAGAQAAWRPMTTMAHPHTSMKLGSVFGSAAFIWDRDNQELMLTHPHKAGTYHHSSISQGRRVRCAGMWNVANGKVTHITNSSGHYRPATPFFWPFILFLQGRGVFTDKTLIWDLSMPQKVAEPGKFNEPSQYISFQEYQQYVLS